MRAQLSGEDSAPRESGAGDDALARMPTRVFSETDSAETPTCAVCMCDAEAGDTLRRLPCGHEFRRDALGTWLKNHSTCPVCRHQLKVGSAMAEAIAEAGGLANIEALQQHSDSDIYVKARRLIEAFFST